MSTNATISVFIPEKNLIKSIYLHWDGYVESAGVMLSKFYNTQDLAEKLVNLGSLSILAERLEPSPDSGHSFENKEDGVCVAYHRDRGEKLKIDFIGIFSQPTITDTDFECVIGKGFNQQEYNYLFFKDTWYVKPENRQHWWNLDSLTANILNAE